MKLKWIHEHSHRNLARIERRLIRFAFFLMAAHCIAMQSNQHVLAQNGSLFHRPIASVSQSGGPGQASEVLPSPPPTTAFNAMNGPQPYMDNASHLGLQTSLTYLPPVPARTLKMHDIVQIRIDEVSTSLATGSATSRKTTSYDAVLKDWIRLVGLDTIKPAPQSDGDPRFQTIQNEVYRGDSNIRTQESFTRNIAAEIVDIKPNGHIVLDATKDITENDNSFRYSLTGTCRSQDIGPDNVVLSRNLIRSKIDKQDLGHVRDGYSRGWGTKLLARIKPF